MLFRDKLARAANNRKDAINWSDKSCIEAEQAKIDATIEADIQRMLSKAVEAANRGETNTKCNIDCEMYKYEAKYAEKFEAYGLEPEFVSDGYDRLIVTLSWRG